jgi:hypothetical protein
MLSLITPTRNDWPEEALEPDEADDDDARLDLPLRECEWEPSPTSSVGVFPGVPLS